MKRHSLCTLLFVFALVLFAGMINAGAAGMHTETGKVTAVEPRAIVIDVGTGKSAMTVGAAVGHETRLVINGKSVPAGDLEKDIQVGDRVTVKYLKSDDLYAREIIKK